ncbi:hypothetical protein ACTI_74310 [Actinoplanes sp. OR16]|nr:hypothetical protein ACTI_74310 [Actinoplanes sp. OR16]
MHRLVVGAAGTLNAHRSHSEDFGRKGCQGRMVAGRSGRGRPIGQQAWPPAGSQRDWLAYCDKIHQANGLPSLRTIATSMGLSSATRVNDMLRGLALPADGAQARALLEALGALSAEADRGVRLYETARAEREQATRRRSEREADRPDWWLRSGYLEQVADIAPLKLLDREAELAELADWCVSGDEPYVWWQAEPRAGKSALMAWFVLHPPPEVWVISFFVTARYAGQADSTAFTDGLLDQLSAITGAQVPPSSSGPERDRLRRRLLGEAAARAVKTGRRLVLLVDGLDEDCGSGPGSGMPSIAASLPKRPPDGLRLIVAGRPDPPLPADVHTAADHPLHGCGVRWLNVSPHAQRVTELAKQELDEILAVDQDRHDGLGYQVLGLVTACGGGLDRRDLQQLIGRPAFEIDRLMCGVFGRTVAGRADPGTTKRAFLFTHETLRQEAHDRLGRDTLDGFAARLHTWADGYRRSAWPDDTPTYLLRGYPRMLADAHDHDRLIALATDPARHDRMLDASGGDAAALAEITMAFTLTRSQPRPDLSAALRLAWYRDQLTERNTNIPTELPAVWAMLGQAIRGEALARSITNPDRQGQAFAALAGPLAVAGEYDRAEQIARSIIDPQVEARALAGLVERLAVAGEYDRAEQIARSITDPLEQGHALVGLVGPLAVAGEYDRAELIAGSITRPDQQGQALVALVERLAVAGEYDRAERIARSITRPDRQGQALVVLVERLAVAGDADRAEQTAESITDPQVQRQAWAALVEQLTVAGEHARAEQIVRSIDYRPAPRSQAWAAVSQRLAAADDLDRAEQTARSITDPQAQGQAWVALAERWAAAGEYDRAEQIARSISDPQVQAQALVGLAKQLAVSGEHDRAAAVAAAAEQIARSITNPRAWEWALVALAEQLAATGEHDRAERIARSVTHPYRQGQALTALVASLSAAGEHDRAEQVARSITDPQVQGQALTALAAPLVVAGEHDHAEQIALSFAYREGPPGEAWTSLVTSLAVAGEHDRAERIARTITDPPVQAQALVALVEQLAVSGEHDRAEQIARSITFPDPQGQALTALVTELAAAGEHDRAERTARSITRPDRQGQALAALAQQLAVAGRRDRAAAVATAAEQITRSIAHPHWQAEALTDLAKQLAAAGEHDRAERIARSITRPDWQGPALAALAGVLAAGGEHDRAERIARSIAGPDWQGRALADLAGVAGTDRARSLVAEALAIGRWTIPLSAVAGIDATALATFADECT